MDCLHPCSVLDITGKYLATVLGFAHDMDTAQQMDSCCPWVMLKLVVFTEGTGSSRAGACLSDKSYDLPMWEPRA